MLGEYNSEEEFTAEDDRVPLYHPVTSELSYKFHLLFPIWL